MNLNHFISPKDRTIKEVKRLWDLFLDIYCNNEEQREFFNKNCFISGGCFKSIYHNEILKDVDIYFKSNDAVNLFHSKYKFNKYNNLYYHWAESNFAKTLFLKNINFQFITRFSGPIKDVISNFDFQHSMNYYDPGSGFISFQDSWDFRNKELLFNIKASHPINSLIRLQKFVQQGWKISDEEIIKISLAINNLNLHDKKIFEAQTEAMYFDSELYEDARKEKIETYNNSFTDLLKE